MTGTIIVTAAQDRRRAGRRFLKGQPVRIGADDLSRGELAALEADPLLAVSSEMAAAEKPAPKTAARGAGARSGARKKTPGKTGAEGKLRAQAPPAA